jgi:hypothetical protein
LHYRQAHCNWPVATIILVLIASGLLVPRYAAGRDTPVDDPLVPINQRRNDAGVAALTLDERLSRVATEYAVRLQEQQCICPVANNILVDDAEAALDPMGYRVFRAGLVVAYSVTAHGAVVAASRDPAHTGALLERELTMAGVSWVTIEPGESWLARPVGGVGPDIDLAGYTLVLIVTAGVQK